METISGCHRTAQWQHVAIDTVILVLFPNGLVYGRSISEWWEGHSLMDWHKILFPNGPHSLID